METFLHIDWLSITFPYPKGASADSYDDIAYFRQRVAYPLTKDKSVFRDTKPLYGYTSAYCSSYGTLVMYGRQEMGVHVQYSGQALYMLNINGVDTDEIIRNALILGGRATRVDIALNIYNGSASVSSFSNALKLGQAVTASKTWRNLENAEGGQTCYIGSRSSERMVRVYDKKAESAAKFGDVGADSWIRAEVELKGDRAKDFLNACRDNELEDVMLSHLVATVDFPTIKDWREATKTTGKHVEPAETHRKLTKTRHWLMATVAPVIARECAQDPEFLATLQSEIHNLIEGLLGPKGAKLD